MPKKTNDKFSDKLQLKKEKALKEEKIVNDFLLQISYSILAAIVVLFVYNCRMFNYGTAIGLQAPYFIWTLFGIFALLSVFGFVKGRRKKSYKIFGIYMAISAGMMFWCIGVEQFLQLIKLSQIYPGPKQFMSILFWLIGLSIPVEIIVYFVRMTKLKKK